MTRHNLSFYIWRGFARAFPALLASAALLSVGPSAFAAEEAPAAPLVQEAASWKAFSPKSGVFTAQMPGKVDEDITDVPGASGKQYMYVAMDPKKWGYTVGYIEFGEKFYADMQKEITDPAKLDKTLLDKVVEGFTEEGDFKKVKPTPIKVNGLSGYDLIAPPSAELAYGQMRCFVSGRRVFFLFVMQNKEFESAANRKKFLDSVRLK